jgi:hypothetical protein
VLLPGSLALVDHESNRDVVLEPRALSESPIRGLLLFPIRGDNLSHGSKLDQDRTGLYKYGAP